METIVYMIRHSVKFNTNNFGTYLTTDDKQRKTEKKMLSVEGEKRAEILSKEKEFNDIDVIYSSNYTRAMQTAKYFLKDKKLNVDERFNERKLGIYDKEKYPHFFCTQYLDKEIKGEDGENQIEVNKRVTEAFFEVVENNRFKKIAIFSHGTAISFFLMNWCKLLDVQPNLLRKLEYNGKILIDRPYNAPEVFKITLDENDEVTNIENIEFESLK